MKPIHILGAVCGTLVGIVLAGVVIRLTSHGQTSTTAPTATPPPPPPSATVAPIPTRQIAVAVFKKEGVEECADIQTTGPAADKIDDIKMRPKDVRIEQSCEEAFGDRPVLATCFAHKQGDAGTLEITEHYYEALSLENDVYMHQCLKDGGHWTSVGRDSDEYRRSLLQGRLKKLEK